MPQLCRYGGLYITYTSLLCWYESFLSVPTYSLDSICKACVLFTQSRQHKYSSSWREGRNKEAEATYYWAAYFYIRELSFPSKRTWCIEFEYIKIQKFLEMSPKLFRGMISEGFGNDMIEVMIPPPHIFISVYTLTKTSSREKSYWWLYRQTIWECRPKICRNDGESFPWCLLRK